MKKNNPMRILKGGKPAAKLRARSAPRHAGATRGKRTVGDVMVPEAVTIDPSDSLAAAARTMEEANVGMLPVIGNGRLRGVITDRDIVIRAVARNADASSTRVGE